MKYFYYIIGEILLTSLLLCIYYQSQTINKQRESIKELISKDAELIITREPLKFKDILIHENKYEVL